MSGLVTIELFDVSGGAVGEVLAQHIDAWRRVIELDVSDLPVGIYFARVQGPEGATRTSRMVALREPVAADRTEPLSARGLLRRRPV